MKHIKNINNPKNLKNLKPLGVWMMAIMLLASCSMINEELPECAPPPANYTLVDFVYTYNMSPTMNSAGEEEDWFDSHVGAVHLYVFDENDTYLFDNTVSRTDMTGNRVDFTMRFDDKQLIPGNTYKFVAMARGNHAGYTDADDQNVFFIPLDKEMIPGVSKLSDYEVKLDRDDDHEFDFGIVNVTDQLGQNQEMIDTIWSTQPGLIQIATIEKPEYHPTVEQQPDVVTRVQIPMMRLTNAITVNILHPQFSGDTDTEAYRVLIDFPRGNGRITFDGEVIDDEDSEELFYRALRKNMVPYTTKDARSRDGEDETTDGTTDYAMQSVFGVSRLLIDDESELQVRDATKEDYPILFSLGNFSNELARMLNESFSDDQEFLDREYDFTVEVQLDENGNWQWYSMGISILSWARRVYRYDL